MLILAHDYGSVDRNSCADSVTSVEAVSGLVDARVARHRPGTNPIESHNPTDFTPALIPGNTTDVRYLASDLVCWIHHMTLDEHEAQSLSLDHKCHSAVARRGDLWSAKLWLLPEPRRGVCTVAVVQPT